VRIIEAMAGLPPQLRATGDTLAAGSILISWLGVLPVIVATIASITAAIWYGCLITSWIVNKNWRAKQ